MVDEPFKDRLKFYEIFTNMINGEVNIEENINNIFKIHLFPEINNMVYLYDRWNNSQTNQDFLINALTFKLKKECNYASNYLIMLAYMDIEKAIKQLEKLERKNFPKGIGEDTFTKLYESNAPIRYNVFSGCLELAKIIKGCHPKSFPIAARVAEALINSSTLPFIIPLENYKEILFHFFRWCDEHQLTKTSLCDRFLKKIEDCAAAHKDHTLYLWIAKAQKILRKQQKPSYS